MRDKSGKEMLAIWRLDWWGGVVVVARTRNEAVRLMFEKFDLIDKELTNITRVSRIKGAFATGKPRVIEL